VRGIRVFDVHLIYDVVPLFMCRELRTPTSPSTGGRPLLDLAVMP
jgi:hypothetical protein